MIDPKAIDMNNWGWGTPYVQPTGQTSTNKNTGPQATAQGNTTTTGGTTMPTQGFQYPSEWDTAGDSWSRMISGNYNNPGMEWLKNMMSSGGNAFDVSGWDKMYRPAMMDQYSNAVKQMAEQAGVGGTRYGSGLQNSISNYGGQLQNQYTKDLWDRMFGAYEAGQGRATGAANALAGYGAAGTEGLLSLGRDRAQLPLTVASMMSGIGQGQTAQQIDPWSQMMMSLLGGTGQAGPQTYTPSMLQNLLQSLSQTLGNSSDWGG